MLSVARRPAFFWVCELGAREAGIGSKAPIRVIIADDHPVLRGGVSALLRDLSDILLVGEAANGEQAVAICETLRPDVILLDLQMPGLNGFQALRLINERVPNTRAIILTTYPRPAHVKQALDAGAWSYLIKTSLGDALLNAIRNVAQGKRYFPEDVLELTADHQEELTKRETIILELIAEGKTNKQIGYELSLSSETIKVILKALFVKLGVADRTQAAVVAARQGIINLDA